MSSRPTSPGPDTTLIASIDTALRTAADPTLAPAMQAYMKSAMPYLGIRTPAVRALTRARAHEHPPVDADQLLATVRTLWDGAVHREQRYAAIELLDTRSARVLMSTGELYDAGALELVEHLIRTGSWWDHVDSVSHRVGDLLRQRPGPLRTVLRTWATDRDFWIRRSAIICQLGFKAETDTGLLTCAIEANVGEREFFLRKAIGWALREYARTDPGWVVDFAATHALSPLSRREALKHL